jgi:hypothetical protein
MVREKVCAGFHAGFIFHEWAQVPVCELCVTDHERKSEFAWGKPYTHACHGCGRRLTFVVHWERRDNRFTCDNVCARRALRKQRRPKRRLCTQCSKRFSSARKDAQFCSSACKQKAYRKRLVAEAVEPEKEAA